MIPGKEFLEKYVSAVKEMQAAQDKYFHSKSAKGYSDKTLLQLAKDKEAIVKRATADYYKHKDQLQLNF